MSEHDYSIMVNSLADSDGVVQWGKGDDRRAQVVDGKNKILKKIFILATILFSNYNYFPSAKVFVEAAYVRQILHV